MRVKNILFPTDFSACSGNALYYITNMASKLKADIVLMHTYNFSDAYSAIPAEQIFSMKDSLKKEAEDHLQKLINEASAVSPGIHMSYDLEIGFFTDHLVDEIRKKDIDLVALGTEGYKGLTSILFGTNTAKVIDQSPCPVFVIPQEAAYSPIKNIMYLSNFKKEEISQLKYLSFIASIYEATINIIHVSNNLTISVDNDFVDIVSQEVDYPLITFRCVEGRDVSECIYEVASRENVDLIAMYVSHRNFLERVFGPNLTKEISYHTKIPLLVFPEKYLV